MGLNDFQTDHIFKVNWPPHLTIGPLQQDIVPFFINPYLMSDTPTTTVDPDKGLIGPYTSFDGDYYFYVDTPPGFTITHYGCELIQLALFSHPGGGARILVEKIIDLCESEQVIGETKLDLCQQIKFHANNKDWNPEIVIRKAKNKEGVRNERAINHFPRHWPKLTDEIKIALEKIEIIMKLEPNIEESDSPATGVLTPKIFLGEVREFTNKIDPLTEFPDLFKQAMSLPETNGCMVYARDLLEKEAANAAPWTTDSLTPVQLEFYKKEFLVEGDLIKFIKYFNKSHRLSVIFRTSPALTTTLRINKINLSPAFAEWLSYLNPELFAIVNGINRPPGKDGLPTGGGDYIRVPRILETLGEYRLESLQLCDIEGVLSGENGEMKHHQRQISCMKAEEASELGRVFKKFMEVNHQKKEQHLFDTLTKLKNRFLTEDMTIALHGKKLSRHDFLGNIVNNVVPDAGYEGAWRRALAYVAMPWFYLFLGDVVTLNKPGAIDKANVPLGVLVQKHGAVTSPLDESALSLKLSKSYNIRLNRSPDIEARLTSLNRVLSGLQNFLENDHPVFCPEDPKAKIWASKYFLYQPPLPTIENVELVCAQILGSLK
jgi:hypothetical protein